MPVVAFDTLPDASRIWTFGSDRALSEEQSTALLKGVDEHLVDWKAHGAPLTVGRQLRDERFLVVAVDQSTAGASGCSIDGLFRVLQRLESELGVALLGGGRVFYRDEHGKVQSTTRDQLPALSESGAITKNTVVFDTTITDLGQWRSRFEQRAKDSWVCELLGY
jgi:hypothetical protein